MLHMRAIGTAGAVVLTDIEQVCEVEKPFILL
jgi:hypothetical protein